MASDETWAELAEEFGMGRPVAEIKKIPLPEPDEETKAVMEKMLRGEELTKEELWILPDKYHTWYHLTRDAPLDAEEAGRRSLAEKKRDERRKKLELAKLKYNKIVRKMKDYIPLTQSETRLFNKFTYKVSAIESPVVDVDAAEILADVVEGNYTLKDVNIAAEGTAKINDESLDNSPIQLLEILLENVKQRRQNALQTTDSGHFFDTMDTDVLSRVTPLQLNDIIASCSAGIDSLNDGTLTENEALLACESFVKAMVMQEGETKIKQAIEAEKLKQAHKKRVERLAEAAAVSGVISDDVSVMAEREKFDISEKSFDISFVPSDDPDVYKPLEIISYVGMTNCKK